MNVQILADVSVALRAVLERSVVASVGFFANETWLEQYIDAAGTFSADRNDVSVWELVCFLLVDVRRTFELCVVIRARAAQFHFDITNSLPLCGGSGRLPSLSEVLHQIL